MNVCLVWLKSDSVLECGVVFDGILASVAAFAAFSQYFWSGLYQTTSGHCNIVLSTLNEDTSKTRPVGYTVC